MTAVSPASRDWYARALLAADDWLARWDWQPGEAGARLLREAELQTLMRRAFVNGFSAGRQDAYADRRQDAATRKRIARRVSR